MGFEFQATVRTRKEYNRASGRYAKVANMVNNYVVQIYFKGHYPELRKGPFVRKGRKLARRGYKEVGEVAAMLMGTRLHWWNDHLSKQRNGHLVDHSQKGEVIGGIVEKREEGQIGRTRVKRWDVWKACSSRCRRRWQRECRNIGMYIVNGDLRSIRQGYFRLKEMVVVDFQKQMFLTVKPKLAENTIKWKGSDHPLFETFRMFKSVRGRVKKRSELPVPGMMTASISPEVGRR